MVPKNRIIFYMVFLDTAQNTSAKVFSKKVKEIPCITLESNSLVKKKNKFRSLILMPFITIYIHHLTHVVKYIPAKQEGSIPRCDITLIIMFT